MTTLSPLVRHMHALADAGHPLALQLREKAAEFAMALETFSDIDRDFELNSESPEGMRMLGAWQEAREVYNEALADGLELPVTSIIANDVGEFEEDERRSPDDSR